MINRILLLILLCAGVSSAAKVTWLGTTSASPKVAANWSTVTTLPLQTDSVFFTSANLNPCTFDSSFEFRGLYIRAGYTAAFNLNGYACTTTVIDSVASGGNVDLTGTFAIMGTVNAPLEAAGTFTTTGCNLVLGDHSFTTTVNTVQTFLSITILTTAAHNAQLLGTTVNTLALTNSSGGYSNWISLRLIPNGNYTYAGNSALSKIAGISAYFIPAVACTMTIYSAWFGVTNEYIEDTISGTNIFQQTDTIAAVNLFILKIGAGAMKYFTNNKSIMTSGNLSLGNASATNNDSVFLGSSYLPIHAFYSYMVDAGNTFLLMQTSNISCASNWDCGSNTYINPGTSSISFVNTAKGTITAGNSTNSFYQVYLRTNTGIVDSIAGTLRVKNLEQDSGRFVPGPDSIIFAGNFLSKPVHSTDSLRVMTKKTYWKFTNASSFESGTWARVDSLTPIFLNNMAMIMDSSALTFYGMRLPSGASYLYTQTAGKTLTLLTSLTTFADTMRSSSAGNYTTIAVPSGDQYIKNRAFRDMHFTGATVYDTNGTDLTGNSGIVFVNTKKRSMLWYLQNNQCEE